MSKKQAILAVSFGTSHKETREKTIEAIEQRIREQFPICEIRRAFTQRDDSQGPAGKGRHACG